MVEIHAVYEGNLRCSATHGPSGSTIETDAPVDNCGKGERFSPTDLAATSLGVCMMTIMGIYAEKNGIDLGRTTPGAKRSSAPRWAVPSSSASIRRLKRP
jgi:putative redox protein